MLAIHLNYVLSLFGPNIMSFIANWTFELNFYFDIKNAKVFAKMNTKIVLTIQIVTRPLGKVEIGSAIS